MSPTPFSVEIPPVERQPDCIFCKIVNGEAPAHRVFEDERTLAFLDLFPVAEGHTLVVTREHFADLLEAEPEPIAAAARSAWRVARAIERAFAPEGLAAVQLNRAAAGQTVFHYHVHLIPRQAGDGMKLHGRTRGDPERLHANAEAIRKALEGV